MPLPKDFLEILACPETKAPVVEDEGWLVSTDAKTRRRYPIKDEIPIMLIEESEVMDEEAWRAVMKRHGVR
ncbi:MAG: Trm112 family protein [Candidatus Eisenbacteria bacterium]